MDNKLVPTELGYLQWSGEKILNLQIESDRRLEILEEVVKFVKWQWNDEDDCPMCHVELPYHNGLCPYWKIEQEISNARN